MGKEEKKLMRRRLANAYLSSIISISMVLLLVGIASLLIVNARSVTDYFKENLQISVLLKQEVSESTRPAWCPAKRVPRSSRPCSARIS